MADLPKDLVEAMSWDFTKIRDLIIDLNLDKEVAMREICEFLKEKHMKDDKGIAVGREIAAPLSKKMLFFNNQEGHVFVRLRTNIRRGFIEDSDGVPVSLKLKDEGVTKIVIRVRPHPSKFTPLKPCSGHSNKFRTLVSIFLSL